MEQACLIEQTKRTRVKGTGPRRSELKPFVKLGEVSLQTVKLLNDILDDHTQNDLGSDNYQISQHCKFNEVFNTGEQYRQILLQKKQDVEEQVNEYAYTKWDPIIPLVCLTDLGKYFSTTYRFRLSEMASNHSLNWHIDADTSVICRAQICLNETDSTYEVKDKDSEYKLTMKPGEIWFINTGWTHRVVTRNDMRRVAIFGFHFNDYTKSEEMRKV
jgi:hypothetical protein